MWNILSMQHVHLYIQPPLVTIFLHVFLFLIWKVWIKTNAFQNNAYQNINLYNNQCVPYLSSLVNFCISWNMNILCWCAGEAVKRHEQQCNGNLAVFRAQTITQLFGIFKFFIYKVRVNKFANVITSNTLVLFLTNRSTNILSMHVNVHDAVHSIVITYNWLESCRLSHSPCDHLHTTHQCLHHATHIQYR